MAKLCRVLDVSLSGFYAWQTRPDSTHACRDRQLRVLIRASHEASRGAYGSPRIHRDLRDQGHRISRKRVIRLKQAEGLMARVRKRFKRTTMSDHDQPVLSVREGTPAGYIPSLRSPICTSSRWVIRNPVMPSVSTADRGCDVTSVPFTRKRTWELPTSTESVFLDRP